MPTRLASRAMSEATSTSPCSALMQAPINSAARPSTWIWKKGPCWLPILVRSIARGTITGELANGTSAAGQLASQYVRSFNAATMTAAGASGLGGVTASPGAASPAAWRLLQERLHAEKTRSIRSRKLSAGPASLGMAMGMETQTLCTFALPLSIASTICSANQRRSGSARWAAASWSSSTTCVPAGSTSPGGGSSSGRKEEQRRDWSEACRAMVRPTTRPRALRSATGVVGPSSTVVSVKSSGGSSPW
mmetsp:Transcript_5659/g.17450  ORF Transcript_5659/g.17450 Transcript_5659/m.17450 type:complete len:249 (-) Transcript_5659:1248-1994(-)